MEFLTPEQEALIWGYREKWQAIAFSTAPINREKAELAIKKTYEIMGKKAPIIKFCSSPYEANLLLEGEEIFGDRIPKNLGEMLSKSISEIWEKIEEKQSQEERDDDRSGEFPEIWVEDMEGIVQVVEWQERRQKNPTIAVKADLELSALESVKEMVRERLPQDMQDEEIAEYMDRIVGELSNEINIPRHFDGGTDGEQMLGSVFELKKNRSRSKDFMQGWLEDMLAGRVRSKVAGVNWEQLERQVADQLADILEARDFQRHYPCFEPMSGAVACIWLDFCFSVLQIPGDLTIWEAWTSIATECGWIFADDDICLVCDRPRILSMDSENRLHAEGEPAMQFADGYSLYAYHGVIIPEKYGTVHPDRWQARWLLAEDNAEVRRVLIQGIGYARICQDLQAVAMDSFAEYTLLRIDSDVDVEPIYLLKMTCPSTGYIHAMRVPPDVRSAREAITWVNWGVDPEEFGVQS